MFFVYICFAYVFTFNGGYVCDILGAEGRICHVMVYTAL